MRSAWALMLIREEGMAGIRIESSKAVRAPT